MPRPVHFEIHAEDPQRALDFYTAVFGWKYSRWGEQEYWLIDTKDGDQAGDQPGIDGAIIKRQGPAPTEGQAVNAYAIIIEVEDLDALVKKINDNGGHITVAKMPVNSMGWVAYAKDTEGNLFGMMQLDEQAK